MYDTDEADAHRTNILAIASVVVGAITLVAQPLGCCLSILATIPLFVAGIVGIVLGLSGYRQAERTNLAGLEISVIGLTLGAVNAFFSLLWCGLSAFGGVIYLLSMIA